MKSVLKVAVIGIALTVLAAPAFARDVTLYGSARVKGFYTSDAPDVGKRDTDLQFTNQTNSRFGMRASDGPLAGQFEVGIGGAGGTTNFRLLYGTYKADGGTWLVGQAETPYNYLANQVHRDDAGLHSFGAPYSSRRAQLRYTMTSGLYVAGMDPVGITTAGDTNTVLMPQLVVGFANKAGAVDYNVGVTGLTYKQLDESVVAGMLYAIVKLDMGAAKLAVSAHAGQNAGVFLLGRGAGAPAVAVGNVDDATNMGMTIDLNVAGVNIGVGYAADDRDNTASKDDKMAVYANYPMTIAKGFTFTPEIGYYDNMKNAAGADENTITYAGGRFMINF